MQNLSRAVVLALAVVACKRRRAPEDVARVPRPPVVDAALDAFRPALVLPPWACAPWTACPLPPVARTPPRELDARERVDAPGLSLRTVHRFENHGHGRVACHYDPSRRAVACVTDALSADWHVKGVRLVRVDPSTFAIEERLVGTSLHSSFLWGDFNRDGAPDFWGFSDELEDADARAVLYLGTADPWTFRATRPLAIDHPVLGGAVLDADGDGCEDVLVLGTGWEFQRDRPVQYFADGLYRGDCRGGFALANAASGLDRLPDFVGNDAPPRLGRTAVVTDLDGDRCADLVIGNYRAHRDTFARSDCHGRFEAWSGDPDADPPREHHGHAVGLSPWDLDLRGELDLFVFNLWHDDWRGRVTDRSYLLRGGAGRPVRREVPQLLEAPFGAVVADFDGDRHAEVLLATAHRGEPYEGAAVILRDDRVVWRDDVGWLSFRETPAVVDLDLDGAPDLAGDGRVLANSVEPRRRWIGFVFVGRSLSGSVVVLDDDEGGRTAFSLAADGRGQPANLLTIGLGQTARPRRLVVHDGVDGLAHVVDLVSATPGRYYAVTAPDRAIELRAPTSARSTDVTESLARRVDAADRGAFGSR